MSDTITPVGLSRDRFHRYQWDGGPKVPGVTSIIGTLDKPALVGWAKKVTAEAAMRDLPMLTRMVEAGGPNAAAEFLKKIPDFQRDESSSLGSRIHALAEAMARGAEVTIADDEAPFIASYRHYLDTAKPRITAVEYMVYSERHAYGGTADVAWVLDGELWLVDYKTGRTVQESAALQLAGLHNADWAGVPGDPAKYLIPAATRFGILHVRPEQTVLVPMDVTDAEWQTFLALRQAHRWVQTRQPVVKGQPLSGGQLADFPKEKAA